MQGTQTNWACRKCGGVGSVPVHRSDCQAHDAGRLAITPAVRGAREFLTYLNGTYVAEAATLGGQVRADLQQAIERITGLIFNIDQAAIGAL